MMQRDTKKAPKTCYTTVDTFFFLHFVVPMGIFPMGNSVLFSHGKPAARVALPNHN